MRKTRSKVRCFYKKWVGNKLCIALLTACLVQGATSTLVLAGPSVIKEIKTPVAKAIDTRQKTQKTQEKWEVDQAKLVAVYEQLKTENEQLTAAHKHLSKEAARQIDANKAMADEHLEALRIQNEMAPFLQGVTARMEDLTDLDAPFLHQERTNRLARLHIIFDDPEISVAEKYRKTMEALYVEAEYGNTIEVYQEKIIMDNTEVLGNIFRLGRVSLFFLSLDRTRAGVFNISDNQWKPLDNDHVPAIAGAVDMAAKHRPVEVLSLPVGRLAQSQGGNHE